jgi:hypothetical protein
MEAYEMNGITESRAESLASARPSAYVRGGVTVGLRPGVTLSRSFNHGAGVRNSRSGRVVLLLSLLLLLVALGLLGLWSWVSLESPPVIEGTPATAVETSSTAPRIEPVLDTERADVGSGTGGGSGIAAGTEGRGSIRGRLVVDPGVTFPDNWTVSVGPSQVVHGAGPVLGKKVSYTGETSEFVIPDLLLGGYEVRVEAPGMNSKPRGVLLTAVSAHPYLIVTVSPTGFIDGFVFGGDSLPAEGVRVTLERLEPKSRRETKTHPDGMYRFDDVRDGEYRLIFGPPENPLVPARELSFEAPSMRFPNVELAKTTEILIYTIDRYRNPLAGVTVTGFGDKGGRIELVTDAEGKGRASNLPPGRYRVRAFTDDGRHSKGTWDVEATQDQAFRLFLRSK